MGEEWSERDDGAPLWDFLAAYDRSSHRQYTGVGSSHQPMTTCTTRRRILAPRLWSPRRIHPESLRPHPSQLDSAVLWSIRPGRPRVVSLEVTCCWKLILPESCSFNFLQIQILFPSRHFCWLRRSGKGRRGEGSTLSTALPFGEARQINLLMCRGIRSRPVIKACRQFRITRLMAQRAFFQGGV